MRITKQGRRGYDLFVSDDGVNFDVITRNGLGDPYNHGCRVFAITDTGLCIGTANPYYGCQVWQLDKVINNAEVLDASGKYDKKNGGDLTVGVFFKENTLEKIECDYVVLEEGKDYEITEGGVTFKEEFLMAFDKDSKHNFTFFFNVGARGHYALDVVDTTGQADGPTTPTTPENNKPVVTPGTGDETGIGTYMMLLFASCVVALGAVIARRREN